MSNSKTVQHFKGYHRDPLFWAAIAGFLWLAFAVYTKPEVDHYPDHRYAKDVAN